MPYTTPSTITTGQLVTPTIMNNEWGGNVSFLANPPACRVTHNAAQSVTNNVVLWLAFNTETYDTDSMHDTVTNNSRITIKTAGIYVVTFNVVLGTDNDYGLIEAIIRLNGTAVIANNGIGTLTSTADSPPLSVATQYKFAVNDYIEAGVYQVNTSAAANNALSQSSSPLFAATWIGFG